MDKLELIKLPIEKELGEFKTLFEMSLRSDNPLLGEVLGYIRKRNGKMMRPILVLLMAKLFGEVADATLHACPIVGIASHSQFSSRRCGG